MASTTYASIVLYVSFSIMKCDIKASLIQEYISVPSHQLVFVATSGNGTISYMCQEVRGFAYICHR